MSIMSIMIEALTMDNNVLLCQPVLQEFKFYRKNINFIPKEAINMPVGKLPNLSLFGSIKEVNELTPVKLLYNSIINYLNKPYITINGVSYIPKYTIIDLEKLTLVTPSNDGTKSLVVIEGYNIENNNLNINFDVLSDLPKSISFENLPASFIPMSNILLNDIIAFEIIKYKLVAYSMYSIFSQQYSSLLLDIHRNKYKFKIKHTPTVYCLNPYKEININNIIRESYNVSVEKFLEIASLDNLGINDELITLGKKIVNYSFLGDNNKTLFQFFEKVYLEDLYLRTLVFSYLVYMSCNSLQLFDLQGQFFGCKYPVDKEFYMSFRL